jgi:hypothetical protein
MAGSHLNTWKPKALSSELSLVSKEDEGEPWRETNLGLSADFTTSQLYGCGHVLVFLIFHFSTNKKKWCSALQIEHAQW